VLVGHGGLVARARRIRKMLGGGMRQAGILAAAGIHALEHHVARLADDHANAQRLAGGLAAAGWVVEAPETNMVFVKVAKERCEALQAHLAAAGVTAIASPRMRLVTHLDVDAAGIDRTVAAFSAF
jgi:threonine aldolase